MRACKLPATLAIAVAAVTGSIVLTWIVLSLSDVPDIPILEWLPAAIIVPAIVAPITAHIVLTMAYELSAAKVALAQAAMTDALTGVSNRRSFMQQAEIEFARASRAGTPLSIIMLDVDYFKAVNDSCGHSTGDLVLCAIANACRSRLRASDLFARFGGEEFVALLPIDRAAASAVAEDLRGEVATLRFEQGGLPGGITVSIGVASGSPHDTDLLDILDEADRQLYAAKNAGRNRVVTAAAA